MKPIQILMPMGGLGQRFRNEGYSVPKPLIDVQGTPMFVRALNSFNEYDGPKQHVFVIRQDAEDEYGLATQIAKIIPDAKISLLQADTRGAVETCLAARSHIDPGLPLVVMDCDFSFTSALYFEKVRSLVQDSYYSGVLLSFDSDWDRYSYARTNEYGDVVETAEKQVISNNALAGAYCFGSGKIFLDAADDLMQKPISDSMKEYYISLLYNKLLRDGNRVALAKVDTFDSFGTPEELTTFLADNENN